MSKQALITGATGGIGRAIARKLAGEGYSLTLHYHTNAEKANDLRNELTEQYDVEVITCQADLSMKEGVRQLLNALPRTPDSLIHNAGQAHYGLFTDVDQEDYNRMVQLHLTSPFQLTQALAPKLMTKGWGRILFVTSIWAETGASCEAMYAMVKGGMTSLMKSLAKEFAPSGITVNAISPGIIDTPMMDAFETEEKHQLMLDIPVGRFGTPDEVAHAVNFLLQRESGYVTGQVIRVNGGWYT